MKNAWEYLIASLINSEKDELAINTIFSIIQTKDVPEKYRALYQVIQEVWGNYGVIEPLTIFDTIREKYPYESFQNTLIKQCNTFWNLVVTNAFWKHYLSLVIVDIKKTKLKQIGTKVNQIKNVNETIKAIKQEIDNIETRYRPDKTKDISEICSEYMKNIEDILNGKNIKALKTGLKFENCFHGYHPGDYFIFAARPKMGKTALILNVAVSLLQQGKSVMFISNEMDETAIMNRIVSIISGVSLSTIYDGMFTDSELKSITKAIDEIEKMKLHLYCLKFQNVGQIRTEAKSINLTGNLDMIIIDYLQLFQATDYNRRKSRYDEVSAISWETKMLANELKVPVIAVSQLNRELEKRMNKRPMPSDLRDSGSLEQDASAVVFIYRDEIYNQESKYKGLGEINVAINRNGTTGTDYYQFILENMRIINHTVT
ncbi:MAG TPA: hypothetical protein DFI01_08030 [Bacteroidales bacterium]|nr:hypothetical protein [Bacteroidales bacterium]